MQASHDTTLATAVTFRIGGQRYALPLERVREIQKIVAFAEMPDESAMIVGMVDVRGEVLPVVDARLLLGLQPEPYTLETPMIFVTSTAGPVALIVDAVDTVVELSGDAAAALPAAHALASRMCGAHRVDGELVFLLDADALLAPVDLPGGGQGASDE
ncbi:MAG: chemotaxis protein CheW [Coriobacteriia bacterium]|nr:chemotaxis protein CheW [Coriobacteriia bacterium]